MQQELDLDHQRLLLLGELCPGPVAIQCRTGRHFSPVQSHDPGLDQARLLAEQKHLKKHRLQALKMLEAEGGDGPKIRPTASRQPTERHVVNHCLGNFAAGRDAHAVGVKQDLEHHHRMVGCAALAVVPVTTNDWLEVQGVHLVRDKPGQVLLRKPFIQIWRQEQQLMGIVIAKVETHDCEPLSSD